MKRLCLFLLLFIPLIKTYPKQFTLFSPNNSIKIVLTVNSRISFSVFFDNNLFFSVRQIDLLTNANKTHSFTVSKEWSLPGKKYNTLALKLNDNLFLEFRVYNNGIAYRWRTSISDSITIFNEILKFDFPSDYQTFFPQEKSLISHYERSYLHLKIKQIPDSAFASLPVLIKSDKYDLLISDADLYDYPNMFLQKLNDTLQALFPKYVLKTKPSDKRPDRNQIILKQADYIAKTAGPRTFPWRVFMLARKDKDLISNNLVYDLSRSNPYDWNFSWVKPGKVAWDWWNALQLEGVNFKPGINTQTYKYYIDFAAHYGLQYVILDEGWSRTTTDLLHFKPGLDVKELIQYAQQKNIGIILWVLWGPLNKNMQTVLDSFAAWGVAGIKVDFMQRADQKMVNFYEKCATEAAKRHLIVDFHGAYKPSGLRRAFPNVLSYEGVKGAEHNKWSADITPTHNVTLPFIRNVVGPMDYTPGGMRNVTKQQFKPDWYHPKVMSTRAQQVAMYIVYYSPLQMLADSPTEYEKNDETTRFIARIPTVWDQTVPLDGNVGQYVVLARRYGRNWYIGAMNGQNPRTLMIDLSFLPKGKKYLLEFFADTPQSAQQPTVYKTGKLTVDKDTKLTIQMQWGGGYAAILTPIN